MSNEGITVNINIPNRDIERLEKTKRLLSEVKQILEEIRSVEDNFNLSNIIETNKDTILVFNCNNVMYKQEDLKRHEEILSNKFNHKCIILNGNITLDKAIGIDYAKGRDYTTTTYYNEKGNPIKEETTQYK